MKKNCISIGKLEIGCMNEDAAMARENVIAVSDGAGGGGLFAERWSRYLLDHLPEQPMQSAEELDTWIGQIWELFYDQCETDAKLLGGLSLDKFYDEGAFATLVAVWKLSNNRYQWISYGDSVAFCYNYKTRQLQHSFGCIGDFDNPPYLINCKDELNKSGFKCGTWTCEQDSVVFVASDALAHYILMMYEVAHREIFDKELTEAESHHSKNENYIKTAKTLKELDFEKHVLRKLMNCMGHSNNFTRHIKSLLSKGLMAHDDYSLAMFPYHNLPVHL